MRFLVLLVALLVPGAALADVELYPFYTRNISPVVSVFGLPAAEGGALLRKGRTEARLVVEAANNFTFDKSGSEQIVLDGETYHNVLALRWGAGKRLELGADLKMLSHDGGVFDGFIESWHDAFDLPGANRDAKPEDRLLYVYERNGEERLGVRDETTGLGDLSLHCGWQVYRRERGAASSALGLRTSLKLPTGDSDDLLGSGGFDATLRLDWERQGRGHAFFAGLGGMYMEEGDVLPELQKNWAAFGSLGAAWRALRPVALKVQIDGHTAFYEHTGLRELGDPSLQLILGGTAAMPGGVMLDLGVSEDIAVDTAPDVVFHLALKRRF